MLRLVNISKTYSANSNKVQALDNVSLNFRKNEFVSVLGPSGSGKTTLLNIVGGLDKYTTGDLIIAGKSTKDFKDRDWDFYRNQRIGFIFQSYNLIPHQTVLNNVELALTISGVNKQERVQRAKEALDKVGLSDQYYKKPNQLSGGQCQRVAIARALVNNPEILLADEPTGALDTKTSEQIMKLIKEISKDRLVIMVTHNPDLADRYSNRIIRLLDGRIEEDSHPFDTDSEIKEISALDKDTIDKKSKAKMGLLTANKLSFRNLVSKKGRTILVSIASSIGIIGVSTVLSVSFGVSNYVAGMQDDMLSSYPLKIAETSLDVSSLMSGLSSSDTKKLAEFNIDTQLGMDSMIEYLMDKYSDFTKFASNDINQDLVDYVNNVPSKDVSAIQYDYGIDVTNNIFTNWQTSKESLDEQGAYKWMSLNGLTQRYISELSTVSGFTAYANYVNLFTNFMKEMPGDESYILSQYDMLGESTFANNSNEIMVVVSKDRTITDLLLGQLGIYDHDSFINIGKKAVEIYKKGSSEDGSDWGLKRLLDEKKITQEEYDARLKDLSDLYQYDGFVNYSDLIGREFYYLPHEALWDYSTKISDETYMDGTVLFFNSEKIYSLRYDNSYAKYGLDLLQGDEIDIATPSNNKKVLFVRGAKKDRNPETFFDGTGTYMDWFGISSIEDVVKIASEIKDNPMAILKVSSGRNISIKTGEKKVSVFDVTNLMKPTLLEYYDASVAGQNVVIDAEETDTLSGYYYDDVATQNVASKPKATKMKISGILVAKDSTNFGSLSRGVYYTKAFTDQYMNDAANKEASNKIINDPNTGLIDFYSQGKALTTTFGAYTKYSYLNYDNEKQEPVLDYDYAFALNGDLSNSVASLFSSFLGSASTGSNNEVYARSLTGVKASYDEKAFKATFEKLPQEMSIYPKDFASKDNVTRYLDEWNSDSDIYIGNKVIKAIDRTELTYTDTVAMIITVINSLITIVTSALVAFTSLSLVVSCFMIAVITYISVMERVKEIGVIRSLGGRKKDVSRLFLAENFMTGLASGILGIAVTYLLSILINVIVHYFGAPNIAMLPWWMALIMIGLSILLNVISGFIPSKNAARQDPVNALRSE